MFVWIILALCAVGTTSEVAPLSSFDNWKAIDDNAPEDLVALASEYIPYSEESDQLFKSTAELIASFLGEVPNAPELPAVIPSGSQLQIPSKDFEIPHAPTTEALAPTTEALTTTTTTAPLVPQRPVFNRSMHLRVALTVPASDYTDDFDIQYHSESNTARTVVGDTDTITYRLPAGDGKIQYLKAQRPRILNIVKRICEKSPPFPAGPGDTSFPDLPNLEPFSFIGYKTEESRRVEHWQHVVIGKPGEDGAARGESLNYTHDFFVNRDGGDAVPLRYTVTTDSSVLGPASDTYTHRYTLLPAPTSPLIPDTDELCDHVTDDAEKQSPAQSSLNTTSRPGYIGE